MSSGARSAGFSGRYGLPSALVSALTTFVAQVGASCRWRRRHSRAGLTTTSVAQVAAGGNVSGVARIARTVDEGDEAEDLAAGGGGMGGYAIQDRFGDAWVAPPLTAEAVSSSGRGLPAYLALATALVPPPPRGSATAASGESWGGATSSSPRRLDTAGVTTAAPAVVQVRGGGGEGCRRRLLRLREMFAVYSLLTPLSPPLSPSCASGRVTASSSTSRAVPLPTPSTSRTRCLTRTPPLTTAPSEPSHPSPSQRPMRRPLPSPSRRRASTPSRAPQTATRRA